MGTVIQRLKTVALVFIVLTLWSWPIQEIRALEFVVTSDNHSGYNESQDRLGPSPRTRIRHRRSGYMIASRCQPDQ